MNAKHSTLSFSVQATGEGDDEIHEIVPEIDGESLIDLVALFETQMGFDNPGNYGPLIPEFFKYGSLDTYFLGYLDYDSYWAKIGGNYLLGCQCREVGCWPLFCNILRGDGIVEWKNFKQPHRPNQDYSTFGPFTFDLEQYKEAVALLHLSVGFRD